MIRFTLPITTKSELNQRDHHMERSKRANGHKDAVMLNFSPRHVRPLIRVTMVRVAHKELDSDGLQGALKWVRDGIAAAMRIIDSDGASEITVPTEACGMSPAWNPRGTMLAYTTCGGDSRLFVIDLSTGRSRTLLGPVRNVAFSTPTFMPDGNTIVFARSGESGTDLYSISVAGGDTPRRLTLGRAVENSQPTVSPDGHRIVYVGNALGRPELYIMNADGTNAEVLTNYEDSERNYRSDPDWSPDGRSIAYTERLNGRFQVRTINPTGSAPKYRTSEGVNEQPAWAPDGRHIVFTSSRSGVRQLWVMDIETGRTRQLTQSAGSRLGAWSPRLNEP